MEQENPYLGITIVGIIIVILVYPVISKIKNGISGIYNVITSFVNSQASYLIIGLIVLAVVIFFICLVIAFIQNKKHEKREEQREISHEAREIDDLILKIKDTEYINQEDIQETINLINKKLAICSRSDSDKLKKYVEPLKQKLLNLSILKEASNYKEEVRYSKDEAKELRDEVYELRTKRQEEEAQKERSKEEILRKFNIEDNFVFEKNKLSKKEIEVLKEKGYKQINEYCVYGKKVIPILVRTYSNHSPTHVFLVWSVIKLLKKLGIKEIKEHKSFDADITFKHEGKWFALEIEIGSLLRKHKQLQEKLNYLNKKYPKRWLFIISNKKLLPKYRKYGLSTPRKEIQENLKKLMKNT